MFLKELVSKIWNFNSIVELCHLDTSGHRRRIKTEEKAKVVASISIPCRASCFVLNDLNQKISNIYPTESAYGQHPSPPPCRLTLRDLTQPLPACSVGSYTDGK